MDRVDALFWEIQMIMIRALISVQPIMINDRHCFEMYGYDIMIDQDLKPWLIEVNASPSLTANTREDYLMKTEMLHGMLDVVDMEQVYFRSTVNRIHYGVLYTTYIFSDFFFKLGPHRRRGARLWLGCSI